ncbi:MAG TPA: AAA family ATPase [Mobilitalea sp.]|nr:AAA family ATPase [Mobilitalea sp.]
MPYVNRLKLSNFMIFENLDLEFSKNINIISGENSTGKTAVLKILYSSLKAVNEANKSRSDLTREKNEEILVSKLQGVFRPDNYSIGRLVGRIQGSNRAEISVGLSDNSEMSFGFGNRQEKHLDMHYPIKDFMKGIEPVYIPPKEIISATENFISLYTEYHIAFEETYYDLARLLDKPLRKGPNTNEQNRVLDKFGDIISGNIVQRDKKFYLKTKGVGEIEMGLVSEGYRKLSTIMYLILSGSLGKNSILLWDEPESNMNPKMIQPLTEALIELAQMGVQIFVTTHDYFLQQSFSLATKYEEKGKKMDINFISLYKEDGILKYEKEKKLNDLKHNSIMEEFDHLYEREQELFYGHN